MTDAFVEKHNEKVKEEDIVWHIGDFCWLRADHHQYYEGLLNKLNGTHHLVLGNHDYCKPFYYIDVGFTTVHTAQAIDLAGYKIVMAHDPAVYAAIHDDVIFLCGHIHLLFKALPDQKVINVGVDAWDYYPINLKDILLLLEEHKDKEKLSI